MSFLFGLPCIASGCAFVTFYKKESAELAMKDLHDKTTLPGVSYVK